MKQNLSAMFGRYLNQPLHHTLIDFRLSHKLAVLIIGIWTNELFWFILALKNDDLSLEMAALLWGQFMLLAGMFVGTIKDSRQNHHSKSMENLNYESKVSRQDV